jgi:hypothetical protein
MHAQVGMLVKVRMNAQVGMLVKVRMHAQVGMLVKVRMHAQVGMLVKVRMHEAHEKRYLRADETISDCCTVWFAHNDAYIHAYSAYVCVYVYITFIHTHTNMTS